VPATFTRPILTPAAARDAAGRTTRLAPRGAPPLVSLTSDFGDRDPSAAICRGVVLAIAPAVRLLDVSHEIEKYSIPDGALVLWCALPYLPVGVHVAVVDPGVGTARLPVAIRVARGDVLVGPDNGLLRPVAERLGGIVAVHALESAEYRLPVVSTSFHGRDIFAPAAAHLALGVPLQAFGRPIDPAALIRLDLPAPEVRTGQVSTAAVYVDTFGNVKLGGERADLERALGQLAPGTGLALEIDSGPRASIADAGAVDLADGLRRSRPVIRARTLHLPWVDTFGSVQHGEALLYEDSYGRLCLAVNRGDAGRLLSIGAGDRVVIRRA